MSADWPRRQAALITLVAAGVLVGFRFLPRGSSLSPMDFVADRDTVLQFCDALNSRPPPAAIAPRAVTLVLTPPGPLHAGEAGVVRLRLTTISRKTIRPEDLLPRRQPDVELVVTDPAGRRLPSVRAKPERPAGEWSFRFAPPAGAAAGRYRVSASFTPAVTGAALSAASAFTVLR